MYEELLEKIEDLEEYNVDLLSKFVKIPTENPPGKNYKKMVNVLREELRQLGFSCEIVEVPEEDLKTLGEDQEGPRYNLLARMGDSSPTVHFNGHYDVVPSGSAWEVTDPFSPIVKNGRLYGRGACDMKAGFSTLMTLVKAYQEIGKEINGTIEVSATADEETGGYLGAGYIVSENLVDPDYVIIGEPSGSESIWFGHKGLLWPKFIVKGKEAHGSTPWEGVNAFEKTVQLADKFMKELKPKLDSHITKYDVIEEKGTKETMTMGGEVRGGTKVNVVPREVEFTMDRRIIPERSVDEAHQEIMELVQEFERDHPEAKVEVKRIIDMEPCVNPPKESKIIPAMGEAAHRVLKRQPNQHICLGGLDMRYFINNGYDTATYGPGSLQQAHKADEYVEIDELTTVTKVYALSLEKLLS